jgi:hypothetical protein
VRNVHISTKLQFQGKAFTVDHGESEIIYRHLPFSDKGIRISIPAELNKEI